ncbi:MAG: hypothetical protein K2K97_00725 [Muribaculaceae bacterium]|nr:hypothetical protein [Muribaculaceae bacterium]
MSAHIHIMREASAAVRSNSNGLYQSLYAWELTTGAALTLKNRKENN